MSSDMTSAAARARNRPKSECMVSACDGADPHAEKECGGPGRLLAYQFSCTGGGAPHPHPHPPAVRIPIVLSTRTVLVSLKLTVIISFLFIFIYWL